MSMSHLNWQNELANAFTCPEDLLAYLNLEARISHATREACQKFPFRVTRSYAERMEKGNRQDPLLLQVLPAADELPPQPGYQSDPVGDADAISAPGVLHKYQGRVLFITTGACAINCRYCFRREFPYSAHQLRRRQEGQALDYLAEDHTIHEVILSGGDPLLLSDPHLHSLAHKIAEIGHIKRLRFHTRIPIVLPSRITKELICSLTQMRLQPIIVLHVNHPHELNEEVGRALSLLTRAGITLLNQSVLLKGINDDADILMQLSESLFQHGVLPYYLHLLDKVAGAAHFAVDENAAVAMHDKMRRHLSGYLVPRLVRERAGVPYKLLVNSHA